MNTAEDIIISKRFFELTPAERETVKELAANEEDYEAMRWFLMNTGTAFAQDKIEPSADLKKGVMAHLQQKQAAPKTIWLNGVGAFLFPAEKKIYQYPALQIAAVAALIVSVVLVYETTNPIQQELAVNDQVQTTTPEQPLAENDLKQDVPPTGEVPVLIDSERAEPATPAFGPAEPADIVSAQDEYYREMSVAEEVKLMPNLDLLEEAESVEMENNLSTVSTGSGSTGITQSEQWSSVENKQEGSKKQSDNTGFIGKDKNAKLEDVRSDDADKTVVVGSTSNTAPAGYAYTTTTKETGDAERDGEKFTTATAGGVFGDAVLDSTSVYKADADEESQTKYSITDSKILKKLFFVVK